MSIESMRFDRWPVLDPDERERLDAESERLYGRWADEIEELDWRMYHDLGDGFYGVLAEYEERGAPLGDPFEFLPPEAMPAYILRRYGRAEDLREAREALERMEAALLAYAPYPDALAYDRFWCRLQYLERQASLAETQLRERGYAVNKETGLVEFIEGVGRRTVWGNAAVRRVYEHMKPMYERAWPDDLHAGKPTRNPKRLRQHIRELLAPWVGWIPDTKVYQAIDNV